VNTPGADVLYRKVAELLQPKPEERLYDVCCGTGTIGLTMAGRVAEVRAAPPVRSSRRCARAADHRMWRR
jgi:tRNA (uracil-5-)-methyltransferase